MHARLKEFTIVRGIQGNKTSSIGVGLVPMTSQAKMAAPRWPPWFQDGRYGSKMAAMAPIQDDVQAS